MILSVVMPTVPGREAVLALVQEAYLRWTSVGVDVRIRTLTGYSTCGAAWQAACEQVYAEEAVDDHIVHLAADDVEPHEAWFDACVDELVTGYTPAPLIHRPDGSVESAGEWGEQLMHGAVTPVSFLPSFWLADWPYVNPIPAIHYRSDNYVTEALARRGRPARVNYAYRFTHHWATAGRIKPNQEDHDGYQAARHRLEGGTA